MALGKRKAACHLFLIRGGDLGYLPGHFLHLMLSFVSLSFRHPPYLFERFFLCHEVSFHHIASPYKNVADFCSQAKQEAIQAQAGFLSPRTDRISD